MNYVRRPCRISGPAAVRDHHEGIGDGFFIGNDDWCGKIGYIREAFFVIFLGLSQKVREACRLDCF
jgi:hypothetical protein